MFKFPVDSSSKLLSMVYFLRGIYKIKDYEFFLDKENESFKIRKYIFTRAVIKIKIFRSCCNRAGLAVLIALLSHSCCSCHTCVALEFGAHVTLEFGGINGNPRPSEILQWKIF